MYIKNLKLAPEAAMLRSLTMSPAELRKEVFGTFNLKTREFSNALEQFEFHELIQVAREGPFLIPAILGILLKRDDKVWKARKGGWTKAFEQWMNLNITKDSYLYHHAIYSVVKIVEENNTRIIGKISEEKMYGMLRPYLPILEKIWTDLKDFESDKIRMKALTDDWANAYNFKQAIALSDEYLTPYFAYHAIARRIPKSKKKFCKHVSDKEKQLRKKYGITKE